jgi:uncharacterized protein
VPLLSVSAHDIDAAGLSLDAELPLAWLAEELADASLVGAAPGKASVRLSRSGKDVIVRGKVSADLRTPCARCLSPARVAIDAELTLLLQPKGHDGSANGRARPPKDDEEYEFTSEEADTDTFDGETVVLDPFLREAILLEVPNFPLCSEDCPGIRPPAAAASEAEAEPPLDPRLAPLSALRDKLDKRSAGEPAKTSSKKKKE